MEQKLNQAPLKNNNNDENNKINNLNTLNIPTNTAQVPYTLPFQSVYQSPYVQYVGAQNLIQSQVVQTPIQVVQQAPVQFVQQPAQVTIAASSANVVQSAVQKESIKGESRIEYVPYEKTIIEYEAVQRTDYVPKEKKITDYYAVEYQTEYIPQVYQDKYIEYVPTERLVERVEYQAVQKQIVHQPVQEVQTSQVLVQQPVVQQSQVFVQSQPAVVQQPFVQQSQVFVQSQPAVVQQPFVIQQTQPVLAPASNVQYVNNAATYQYVNTASTGVFMGGAGLTTSGVRTLGPVSLSVVEEAKKRNQEKQQPQDD